MAEDVRFSNAALSSVAAVLANPKPDEKEKAQIEEYRALVNRCVVKPEGHTQQEHKGYKGTRLYTVTTIAPSARYGGVRTPIICDNFEFAKKVVEENLGDIYELSYSLAVIEAVEANHMYSHLEEAYWYVWISDGTPRPHDGRYHACETPPEYARRQVQPIG